MSTFRILHALAVKGFATQAAIEQHADTPLVDMPDLIRYRAARDWWALTPQGRHEHRQLLEHEQTTLDRLAIATIATRFDQLDTRFKTICTTWQTTGRPPHLGSLHRSAVATVAALAVHAPRFATYTPRLQHAAERYEAGDHTALCAPLTDSYHDVWMELHHDIRLTTQ